MNTIAVITGLALLAITMRLFKNITLSLVIAILTIGIILFIPLNTYFSSFYTTISDWEFWKVIITIFSIYLLGETMSKSGDSKRFTSAIKEIFPNPKVSISLMPALIGLLPMPGGAMFSAPMVKDISEDTPNISSKDALATNYWFRHSMEYFWPLYPAIIIVASMANVSLRSIVIYMLPVGLAAIITGYLLMIRSIPKVKLEKSSLLQLAISSWPIIVVIIFVILNQPGWLVVLLTSVVYLLTKSNKVGALKGVLNKWKTFILLLAVFYFKAFVESTHVHDFMSEELINWSIPTLLVMMVLPFIMGQMTGITQGAVGLSFPLVMSMASDGSGLSVAILAYTFAVAGVLLSPVHLCIVLTVNYFRESYSALVKRIILPLSIATITGVLVFMYI
jgi:integral membrane protein (TIGR00529 family)